MNVIFVYNQHDANEKAIIDRAKSEMLAYVTEVSVMNLDEAKMLYHVSATPAVIVIREDLQGEALMAEGVDGKLAVTGMVAKQVEEEELVKFNAETNRWDNLINAEKTSAEDAMLDDMLDRGIL